MKLIKYLSLTVIIMTLLSCKTSTKEIFIEIKQPLGTAIGHELVHRITNDSLIVSLELPNSIQSKIDLKILNQFLFIDTVLFEIGLGTEESQNLIDFISNTPFQKLENTYSKTRNKVNVDFEIRVDKNIKNITSETYYEPNLLVELIDKIDNLIVIEGAKIHQYKSREKTKNSSNKYRPLKNGANEYIFGENIFEANRKWTIEKYELNETYELEIMLSHYRSYTFVRILKNGKLDKILTEQLTKGNLAKIFSTTIKSINNEFEIKFTVSHGERQFVHSKKINLPKE